ncbi:MAG TPA: diguanylate cyclase [Thermoanaerobaculia bacterium]|nr:diguanylate cyclase [Thermoanaerobaculia bacterium]
MSIAKRRNSDVTSSPDPQIRLLVVDDDPNFLMYLSTMTTRLGFSTETAADGAEALTKLRTARFDLLLCDFEMPKKDGLALIADVRTDPLISELYAVMLTAHDDLSLKVQALSLGYDDFLPKGCTEIEVVARIAAARRLLSRHDHAIRKWQGIASRDELTGVSTRRPFFDEAARLLAMGSRFAVVLFDLDDFKQVNDSHGHLTGDRILRDIGALFLSRTRLSDLIARFGGDEFVLLMMGESIEQTRFMALRLTAEIGALAWRAGDADLRVGATYGIGLSWLVPNATVDQILEAADHDLYANKWLRKNPSATPEELYEYQRSAGSGNVFPISGGEEKPETGEPSTLKRPVDRSD